MKYYRKHFIIGFLLLLIVYGLASTGFLPACSDIEKPFSFTPYEEVPTPNNDSTAKLPPVLQINRDYNLFSQNTTPTSSPRSTLSKSGAISKNSLIACHSHIPHNYSEILSLISYIANAVFRVNGHVYIYVDIPPPYTSI